MSNRTLRLPDQVNVVFGAQALVARFFLAADRMARDRGVYLSLQSDMAGMLQVNHEHRDSWKVFSPIFNPEANDLRDGNAFWICGRNARGEPVATQAARLYNWPNTTFKAEIESLRLFYSRPDVQRFPDELCFCDAPAGERLTGRVCYSGGGWYRPDFRGIGLSRILPRMSRALAMTLWNTDYTISIVEGGLVEKRVVERYGYRNVEFSVDWCGSIQGSWPGMGLIWMDYRELVEDLEGFMLTN